MKNTVSNAHIGLVGNGRLAAQMKAYLEFNKISYSSVVRGQKIPPHFKTVSHVWLAISDSAIEDVYQLLQPMTSANTIWVHFSGAHDSQSIFSVHPLMTFDKTLMSQNDFNRVHLTVSKPSPLDPGTMESKIDSYAELTLSDLIPGAKNPWSWLAPGKKHLYHALCVMAGNFPTILWSEVLFQFQSLAIPDDALYNYLERILSNFKRDGAQALTGPFVRRDIKTIADNLESLNNHPLKPVYESFVKAKGISL